MVGRRWVAWLRIVSVVSLGVSACGGDDDGSSRISTGLPADQKLSSFDPGETKKACEALSDGLMSVITSREVLRTQCVSLGISENATARDGKLEVDVAACQKTADACVEDPDAYDIDESSIVDASSCNASNTTGALAHCDATVAEYEACFNEMVQVLRRSLAAITCAQGNALANSEESDAFDPGSVPQCQSFTTKCPDAETTIPASD